MADKVPSYSICNLLGANRCMSELVVTNLRSFIHTHEAIVFPHRHQFYQLLLFTAGGGTHTIDFQEYEALEGQVYYMVPGQIHSWDFDEHADGIIINFNESFFTEVYHDPQFLRNFPIFNTINTIPVNNLGVPCFKELKKLFSLMLKEFSGDGQLRTVLLRAQLTAILVQLSRVAPSAFRKDISKHSTLQLQQFEFLIETHFKEKRLPKDYAELLFITPNHLNALTNHLIGKSAGTLIRDRILLEARRMLANSDLMVSQIANGLNFEDNAYFTRFFKKYTGVTPEAFRATILRGGRSGS